jgi:hypothetical protein
MRVVYTDEAREDLDGILAYIASNYPTVYEPFFDSVAIGDCSYRHVARQRSGSRRRARRSSRAPAPISLQDILSEHRSGDRDHAHPSRRKGRAPGYLNLQNQKARAQRGPSFSSANSKNPWSGRRDSNPRPRPWQGRALPLSYTRIREFGGDFAPTTGRAMPNAARECNSRREGRKMAGWAAETGSATRNGRKWCRIAQIAVRNANPAGRCGFPRLQIGHSSAI